MSLRINDTAPDFTAKQPRARSIFTNGSAIEDGRFFSLHPKDFTPVCTTELGSVAALQPNLPSAIRRSLG